MPQPFTARTRRREHSSRPRSPTRRPHAAASDRRRTPPLLAPARRADNDFDESAPLLRVDHQATISRTGAGALVHRRVLAMASWAVVKDADLDGTEWPLFAWLHPSDQGHTAPGVERMNGPSACTSISLNLVSRLERDETLPVWSGIEDRRHPRARRPAACANVQRTFQK